MHSGRFKNNDALFFQFSNLHWVNTNNARLSHSRLTLFFHFRASFSWFALLVPPFDSHASQDIFLMLPSFSRISSEHPSRRGRVRAGHVAMRLEHKLAAAFICACSIRWRRRTYGLTRALQSYVVRRNIMNFGLLLPQLHRVQESRIFYDTMLSLGAPGLHQHAGFWQRFKSLFS
ncbi:hypothetical protein SAMN05414139_06946 [Burkholderia sp. D7]|nr:hypothetical protein SAMN05414139_06946 [Burkholderia sp. D7]